MGTRALRLWLCLVALGGLAGTFAVMVGADIEGGGIFPVLWIVGIVGLFAVRPRKRQAAPDESGAAQRKGSNTQG